MGEYKLSVKSANGLALGQLNPQDFATTKFPEGWITVTEWTGRVIFDAREVGKSYAFNVISHELPSDRDLIGDGIGPAAWDAEVEDRDLGESDEVRCCDVMSTNLRWRDVRFHVSSYQMWIATPSIDRLREALKHVAFCNFDPADT